MPIKERQVEERINPYIRGSISAGYEKQRARQIADGIGELSDVPLREAVRRMDSLSILERLGVDPESLLPRGNTFAGRNRHKGKPCSSGRSGVKRNNSIISDGSSPLGSIR